MFKVAGVSKYKGEVKVRFANDTTRVKILDKNGHTDINLIELPNEMDKPEVVKYLLTTDLMQNPEFSFAIDEANEKYNGSTAVKATKTTVLKTGAAKKPAAKAAKVSVNKSASGKPAKTKSGTKSAADVMAELQARVAASTE